MRLLIFLFVGLFSNALIAQNHWKSASIKETQLLKNQAQIQLPPSAQIFDLNLKALKADLKNTPQLAKSEYAKGIAVTLPKADGSFAEFTIYESSILEAGIQAKLSDYRTYKGFSSDNKEMLRMAITPRGFSMSMITQDGFYQIDPIAQAGSVSYALYRPLDIEINKNLKEFSCGTVGHDHEYLDAQDYIENNPIPNYKSGPLSGNEVNMLEYKCAIACTGEFGAKWGDTKEEVFEIILNSANQMNVIFENDFAIRLVLVDESLDIVFLDAMTDPYAQAVSGGQLLGVNTTVLNNAIGLDSYDIGHIYTNGCDDTGGIASLSSSCSGNRKGAGVTCMSGNNIPFNTLRIAAHEFGHQFGANHTFNNCNGNENFGTAYEPGGGTTVMSYAGICGGALNVQSGPDEYYHNISLNEVFNHTRDGGGSNCGDMVATGNTNPTANIAQQSGFFIPMQTPFVLEGTGSDDQDDVLTYNWEQFNLGPQSTLGEPLDNAPSFRSVPPSSNPVRYCPSIGDVINGIKRDAEVSPDRSRKLNFRFTVRDNNPLAGGIDYEELRFESTANAGPFRVIYPNLADTLVVGETVTVEWDVANTDASPVNCSKVNILLSTDGGFTYGIILAENTPNDGSQNITVPNRVGLRNRIMIRAVDNIFYNISKFNFRINEPDAPGFYVETSRVSDAICLPNTLDIDISTAAFQGFSETISFDVVSGLPDGAEVSFSPENVTPGDPAVMSIDMNNVAAAGFYNLDIETTAANGQKLNTGLEFEVIYNDYSDLAMTNPAPDASGVSGLPTFAWTNSLAAEDYEIQVSTSPTFAAEDVVIAQIGLTANEFEAEVLLDNNTIYYWRVRGFNRCGSSEYTEMQAFHTVSLSCEELSSVDTPVNISASGTRTVEARIDVLEAGTIKDVNVKKVKGNHEQVSDLKFTLISPSATEVVLLDRQCGNLANFDFGSDDEAPGELDCPITGGISFTPVEPLSVLIDEDKIGTWVIRIDDLSPGFGGALNIFELELCADQAVNNPFLVTNEILEVPPGERDQIRNQQLLADDTDNTAAELSYTLVRMPLYGALTFDENMLSLGDKFTQADINSNKLRYAHDGSNTSVDNFLFTVEDTKGGWIGITQFDIMIDSDFSSSIDQLEDEIGLLIYPNPVDNVLSIQKDKDDAMELILFDSSGRIIETQWVKHSAKSIINTSNYPEGVYFLKVKTDQLVGTKRIVIQH